MLHSTDYQRYKQKMERLQNKVKKSEKAATIHKSKYALLLEQERKRINRNEKLLHMLEEVDAKAAALATKTERLKILKTQQEFALMNSWRRNNYLHQQLIFSNGQIPNDGTSSILKCTQPIEYSIPFVKSIATDPNENIRYGVPFKSDFLNCISSNQQPPFEPNVQSSSEAEKIINNTLNQQQTLARLNHSQQYPSSSMPFYHYNKDQRQFLEQRTNFEPPQSNQYEPPLTSLSTQQTYGAGYPVPVTYRQNSTTLSMRTLSSYQLPAKIEHNAYYPNLNQQNIINSSLIDVGTNRNQSTLSAIPVKENLIASTAPSFTINSKLPSDETTSNIILQNKTTRSDSTEKALHFDNNGNHTYSTIKNEYQQPPIHYPNQQSQFSSMPGMTAMLPMEDSQKTIDVIISTAQPKNLISQISPTSASMNVMAIIHTPHIQKQPNTTQNQTAYNNIHTNSGGGDLNENQNENENVNCVSSTSNIIQHNKNEKNNNAHEDDQRWKNDIVNDRDRYVYEKQLVDCKISETFANPINVKTSVSSSFGMNDDNNNKRMISTSQYMNNIGTEMTLTRQTTQPSYSHSVNRMQKDDNYQYNEFVDNASREYHTIATSLTPPNESNFKDKIIRTNNRGHITNVDTAPSALFKRRLEEKCHLSIDSGIPLKVCDDDVLLPKKPIATNNVRRRYSVASNLHNLPQNFGSPEPFYLSNAFAVQRKQNAKFDSEEIEQNGKQNEMVELYHHQDDKDGNSNKNNNEDVINPKSNPGNPNKYENGNLNMFTTSLDARRIIEPTTTLNLKQVNSTQNANNEIIESNDQRSSVASPVAEIAAPAVASPLDMINSQTLNMPTFISDDDDGANQNQTTDINQNNDYTVKHNNMQQSRPFTTNQISDDQTFIENTMEQLKLANDIKDEQHIDQFNPIQIGDGNEKIRVSTSHSKTVTWADDPHNNYKKDDAQFYDSANDDDNNNQNNINNSLSNHNYTDEANQLQQYQQNQYFVQPQYQTTDPNNFVDTVETIGPANSYDYQYDENQNLYQDQGFYEQLPGECTDNNTTITNDDNRMILATEQLSDGYQQYSIDSMTQEQPQQDAYYSVMPGENHYTEYTDGDQNQQYFLEVNADQEQHTQQQQQQQQHHQIDNTSNVGQASDERIST